MHVLVTGGAGFIGSNLTDALLARGDEVVILDNFDPYYDPRIKHRNIERSLASDRCKLVEGDITEVKLVEELFTYAKFDAVVHLAALAGVRESLTEPHEFSDVNTDGTITLLEAAREHGQPRFILASTSSVYGTSPHIPHSEDDPLQHCISPYGASKIAAERYAYIYHAVHGLSAVCLRFFTAYGPRQRPDMAIHKFAAAILRGETLPIYGDGSTSRDYTYIGDIVGGVLAALDGEMGWGIYNLGNSVTTSLSELVAGIETALKREAVLKHYPEQAGDPPHTCADISRAQQELNYTPRTSMQDGLARFASWLESEWEYLNSLK